jgi:ribosomal protein L4
VRLQALKTILSARLSEGRLRITNNEELDQAKTRFVSPIVNIFGPASKIVMIVGDNVCPNFMIAQKNISNI